jgi:hypothetical protein
VSCERSYWPVEIMLCDSRNAFVVANMTDTKYERILALKWGSFVRSFVHSFIHSFIQSVVCLTTGLFHSEFSTECDLVLL